MRFRSLNRPFSLPQLAALVFALSLSLSFGAQAQTAPIPQVVVINTQIVLEQSAAAASLTAQLNDANQTNEAAIAPARAQIQERQNQLRDDRPSLSAEEFEERRVALEEEIEAFRQEVDSRRGALEQRMGVAMQNTRAQLQQVVLEIAAERGANLVLERGSIVLMAPEFDITEATLERMNERFPTATLE